MKIVCGVKRATIKILCDGTFKTASKPFRQIYIIFSGMQDRKFPSLWALITKKNLTKVYQNLLQKLTKSVKSFCPLFGLTNRSFELLVSLYSSSFPKNLNFSSYFCLQE